MSYQVIARKWRPQKFEEVTGQEAITRTLRNAIEHERLHHAYLFSGARGVGKTTTARLLAKALNCHKTSKPNAEPCAADDPNACISCKEIAESRSIDVLEIDAASHTGVDDIRETILESINFNPARDRYKVFIIDEVHQLSKSAFNALLKTLEEPPARVEFIMATTELHKVPDTILSRCQEFEFRTIPVEKIFNRLKIISDAEDIAVSEDALREIARTGEGSMRDAQSNFDQVISFSGEQISIQDVEVALGVAGAEMLTRAAQAIAENKPAEALNVVSDLIGHGQDLRNFCRDLMGFFRDLLIFKIAGDAENLLDTAVLSRAELEKNSQGFSEADLIRFFNSLSETESKLREATQPRYVLEIGFMKLIEMRRVAPIEKILERLTKLESSISNSNIQQTPQVVQPQAKTADAEIGKPEKKTLTIGFPLEAIPFPISNKVISTEQIPIEISQFEEIAKISDDLQFSGKKNGNDFSLEPIVNNSINTNAVAAATTGIKKATLSEIAATMPIKLPPITSEELEHVEDNWLDTEFERKLQQTGDNLNLISNAAEIVASLFEEKMSGSNSSVLDSVGNSNVNSNSINASSPVTAAGFAAAKTKSAFVIPEMETEEITVSELPVLPENPTEAEMLAYAENHPLVKKAIRLFRAKIIEIKKV